MFLLYRKMFFQLLIFMLSIGYLVTAIDLGSPTVDGRLQPSFFPLIVGSAAVLFSGILLFREWVTLRKEDLEATKNSRLSVAPIIIVSILIYILGFSALGYFVPSALFVFSMMLIFSEREKIVQKAVISVVVVTIGYLIFEQLFGVRLPSLRG